VFKFYQKLAIGHSFRLKRIESTAEQSGTQRNHWLKSRHLSAVPTESSGEASAGLVDIITTDDKGQAAVQGHTKRHLDDLDLQLGFDDHDLRALPRLSRAPYNGNAMEETGIATSKLVVSYPTSLLHLLLQISINLYQQLQYFELNLENYRRSAE
jgi:hypothetical protein